MPREKNNTYFHQKFPNTNIATSSQSSTATVVWDGNLVTVISTLVHKSLTQSPYGVATITCKCLTAASLCTCRKRLVIISSSNESNV